MNARHVTYLLAINTSFGCAMLGSAVAFAEPISTSLTARTMGFFWTLSAFLLLVALGSMVEVEVKG